MNWSNDEHKLVEELPKLASPMLSAQEQHRMYQQVLQRVPVVRTRRKRQAAVAGVGGLVAVVALTVGLMNQQLPWSNVNGGGDRISGIGQTQFNTVVYEVLSAGGEHVTKEGIAAMVQALERRVDGAGLEHVEIETLPNNRIRVQVAAGPYDWGQVKQLLTASVQLEFKSPDGMVLANGRDVKANAQVVNDPSGIPKVQIEFKDPKMFEQITQQYLGQEVSIWLDNQMILNPTVQEVIRDGKAVIPSEDPIQLAQLLNAGTLPYPLQEVQP